MDRFATYSAEIEAADVDAVVIIGTDHVNQFMPNNMPSFLVAKQPVLPATFWNETREFGIPKARFDGDVDLAGGILRGGLERHFDLAFSNEVRIDHSFNIPLQYLTARLGIPIVPIYTNAICPPLPQAARFYDFGRALRDTIESLPLDRRVAVISSGHVSLEIGGPRMFGGQVTPEFDDHVTALMGEGRVDELIAAASFEGLAKVGNVSHQFLNFLVTLGVAGGGPAAEAEVMLSRFTSPFYRWEA
jgi:protocatechuate 4,5-dioxygenase beta chain